LQVAKDKLKHKNREFLPVSRNRVSQFTVVGGLHVRLVNVNDVLNTLSSVFYCFRRQKNNAKHVTYRPNIACIV